MQNILVLTHGGKFHADEVSAISLLLETLEFAYLTQVSQVSFVAESRKNDGQKLYVFRHNNLQELLSQLDVNDKDIYILDTGNEFNPKELKFDHHHDNSLPATNILVLAHLVSKGFIAKEVAAQLQLRLFNSISDFDLGVKIINRKEDNFNTMINDFKISDFEGAVAFARGVISRKLTTCGAIVARDELVKNLEIYDSGIAVNRTNIDILAWDEDRIFDLYISPNREPNRWSLMTYSSEKFPIPKDEFQTFRHNSGFMAVYKSVDEALLAAKKMVVNRISSAQ